MQKNEQDQIRQTNYPYNRKQCNFMFRTPIQPNQKMYRQDQCQNVINNALAGMIKYGYTIIKCRKDQRPYRQKTMTRKVKLKFHCTDCNHPFTSIVGSFQIKFYPENFYQQKRMKLYYQTTIFRMECKKCRSYCDPNIYQSQLHAVKHSFCNLLSEIMQDFKPPKHKDDRFKMNPDVHKHEEQYCEACKLGKCHNIPKGYNMNYTHMIEANEQKQQEPQRQKIQMGLRQRQRQEQYQNYNPQRQTKSITLIQWQKQEQQIRQNPQSRRRSIALRQRLRQEQQQQKGEDLIRKQKQKLNRQQRQNEQILRLNRQQIRKILQQYKQREQAKNRQKQRQVSKKPTQEKSQSFFTKLKRFFF